MSHAVSSDQNEIVDRANDKNLESCPVFTTNYLMFDTSKDEDEQQPVPDDMDMMNDNMDLSSNNLELEPVAQEIDETVDVNQLDVNELTRSIN